MSRTHYRARFSDGTEIKRSTQRRVYTHAYYCRARRVPADSIWSKYGFSSSPEQAARNMEAESAFVRRNCGYRLVFSEIVAVEVA